jgi:hypothetical protein
LHEGDLRPDPGEIEPCESTILCHFARKHVCNLDDPAVAPVVGPGLDPPRRSAACAAQRRPDDRSVLGHYGSLLVRKVNVEDLTVRELGGTTQQQGRDAVANAIVAARSLAAVLRMPSCLVKHVDVRRERHAFKRSIERNVGSLVGTPVLERIFGRPPEPSRRGGQLGFQDWQGSLIHMDDG